jgi:hypothetical protein
MQAVLRGRALADTLSPDDTLSPAQIAAANPKGIPQAVSTPAGKPSNIADDVLSDPRVEKAGAALTSAYESETKELSAAQRDQERRDSQYRDRMDRMVTAEGVTADDLKPWNAQAELAEHKTDLWSQFGSPGFIVAMLGSAFTAQPMNSALQSGAAAMDAINAGDMKAYDKAFEAWKENSALTIKRLDQEHQQIADIDHLRSSNLAEWRVQMETLLHQYGDERKLALLHNGYYPEVVSAQDGEVTAKEHLATAQQALIQNKALMDSLNGHPAQPGETVTHKDAKGNEMAGGDSRYYKGTDMLGAYTDAEKKINEAKFAGRYGSAMTMSRLQEVAIQDRASEIIKEGQAAGKKISSSEAITQAAQEIRPSFSQPRSPATMAASKYIQTHPKATDKDIVEFTKDFTTVMSRARALGTRSAAIDVAVDEAVGASKQALEASKNVPRGEWVPINEIAQLVREKKSSPSQQRFNIANAALVTAYAQTMSRTGVNSVMAQRRAMDVLKTATGPDAYKAGVEQLMTEMQIVKDAVRAAEQSGEAPASGDAKSDVKGTTSSGVPWSIEP